MRAFPIAALLALSAGAAHAQADCTGAMTQLDAGFCAKAGWERSDGELNRIWGRVKAAADGAGRGEQLLQSQRAWLQYRDATCDSEMAQYAGGSIQGQIYWSCMDRLTLQRNVELNSF